jgi:hypothetical protein
MVTVTKYAGLLTNLGLYERGRDENLWRTDIDEGSA